RVGVVSGSVMRGAASDQRRGCGAGRRRAQATVAAGLGLAVLAVLPWPDVAWGQASTTLDEVVVQGAPAAPRRPSVTPDRSSATTSARSAPTTPQPLSALSVVATTPATGIGFDRSKVPSLVQTLTAED